MTPEAVEFHKALVLLALDAARAWERYNESLAGADLALHGSLLRLAKGIVKAWRTWLVQAHPEHIDRLTYRNDR